MSQSAVDGGAIVLKPGQQLIGESVGLNSSIYDIVRRSGVLVYLHLCLWRYGSTPKLIIHASFMPHSLDLDLRLTLALCVAPH